MISNKGFQTKIRLQRVLRKKALNNRENYTSLFQEAYIEGNAQRNNILPKLTSQEKNLLI